MKVAIVEPVGGHGGMNYYDFALCRGLVAAGIEPVLFTCDETRAADAEPFRIERPYRRIYGRDPAWLRGLRFVFGSLIALPRARLSGTRLAHFHFFHVGPLEFLNVALARLLGMKVVITAHDVEAFASGLSFGPLLRGAYRLAGSVVAHNASSRAAVIDALGVPARKVSVIPHGHYLDSVRRDVERMAARRALGFPEDGPLLLFFGQIKAVKGLDILLEALALARCRLPTLRLAVAGRVWKDDFARYQSIIDARGLADACFLHIRYIPDEQVALYFGASDLAVVPYRRIYQSGVLLMAMSYGVPVLASDLDAMRETVTNDTTGFLFSSGSAEALAARLSEVLASPAALRAVAERATQLLHDHYGWDRIGVLTARCYRSLVQR